MADETEQAKAIELLPLRLRRCGNCNGYVPQTSTQGQCVMVPPGANFLGVEQSQIVGGKPKIHVNGYFPPVDTTVYCHAWKPRTAEMEAEFPTPLPFLPKGANQA
jgi:hypothetical protein